MYLLDTHALLWYFLGDFSLTKKARIAIESKKTVYYSLASLWEIGIKQSIDKLDGNVDLFEIEKLCVFANIEPLHITVKHIEEIKKLPFIHRDPFDRLLVAQAKSEKLILITKDEHIQKYKIKTLW